MKEIAVSFTFSLLPVPFTICRLLHNSSSIIHLQLYPGVLRWAGVSDECAVELENEGSQIFHNHGPY